MANANPPPILRIPESIVRNDPFARKYLEQVNTMLFQLWSRTGGPTDLIEDYDKRIDSLEFQVGDNFNSFVQQAFKEIEGLPEFTMDTEGFTMDSTEFTMDKVIA